MRAWTLRIGRGEENIFILIVDIAGQFPRRSSTSANTLTCGLLVRSSRLHESEELSLKIFQSSSPSD